MIDDYHRAFRLYNVAYLGLWTVLGGLLFLAFLVVPGLAGVEAAVLVGVVALVQLIPALLGLAGDRWNSAALLGHAQKGYTILLAIGIVGMVGTGSVSGLVGSVVAGVGSVLGWKVRYQRTPA
ncbi:hypothetical protein [Halomicrobium salinisoli]|uniref:hypothetical protein n=1 Tax=Halomicrobium salinisoli TaxID=2878391 RepID=UPI001CF00BC7|nr:hypothetical protein [Halomicrobium salinisoli]